MTDPNFSKKLNELFIHNVECSVTNIEFLKVGRHFRVDGKKIVVGRNKEENQILKNRREKNDVLLSAEHIPGPIALICEGGSDELIRKVAGICVRYSDAKDHKSQSVIYKVEETYEKIYPLPISEADLITWRI